MDDGESQETVIRKLGKPVRTVLGWQVLVTAAMMVGAGLLAGTHGTISAMLGGLISICAGLAAAVAASIYKGQSAGNIVVAALGAEVLKVLVMVILLWLVLAAYKDVVVAGFIGSFAVTAVIFGMAFFVRDA